MFDISFGEFVFVVAAASWLVGRRDLPIATKYGGKALGRAIGYMMRLRTTVEELTAGSNEMNTLRQDMKQGYEEFNRVSMEVRNVGRLGGMATAGMYGGVGGMAKHAMTDAAMNGMGGGQTHEGATPKASGVVLSGQPMAVGPTSTTSIFTARSPPATQHTEPLVLGPGVPNAGDVLQRVAEERRRRLIEHQKQQQQKPSNGQDSAGGALFDKTHTERMGGGVDLLVGTLEDKAVLDNYLKLIGNGSPGGITSVPDSESSSQPISRRQDNSPHTKRNI